MSGNKALRRASKTSDSVRLLDNLPLIEDETQLITPKIAEEMLSRNKRNRPINWEAVDKLSKIMEGGGWQLHAQGIILDPDGNILTGQTRLWAIVYSNTAVYMRISRGTPAGAAFVIDRGRPQSARDLSTRTTERKHSPIEPSIARCVCVLRGITKPSPDDIATMLVEKNEILKAIVEQCKGTKKTKSVLMILGAIAEICTLDRIKRVVLSVPAMADNLEAALAPYIPSQCWGKGASFGMALTKAKEIVAHHE